MLSQVILLLAGSAIMSDVAGIDSQSKCGLHQTGPEYLAQLPAKLRLLLFIKEVILDPEHSSS